MGAKLVKRPQVPEGLLIVAPEFIPGYAVLTRQLPSPGGTTEILSFLVGVQSSLRDSRVFVRRRGTGNKLSAYFRCVPPGRCVCSTS